MLSTVHPGDLLARSIQRSPKYLNSLAVWPVCNPASPKTPCLSDSRTDFSMGGVGITQHGSHKVFREPEERCMPPSRTILPTRYIWWIHYFGGKERQGKGHLSNAASLQSSLGTLRNDGQVYTTVLVRKVGLNVLAVQSLPWREPGAFAAHDALPYECGVLTDQQLQTCLVLFQEKPLLLQ